MPLQEHVLDMSLNIPKIPLEPSVFNQENQYRAFIVASLGLPPKGAERVFKSTCKKKKEQKKEGGKKEPLGLSPQDAERVFKSMCS
jgi:hypothetical protein